MKIILIALVTLIALPAIAQENQEMTLPYHNIPTAPETYNAGTVISRMIDGLGFRYYWATEGLTDKDLAYEPGNDGRTAGQTMEHLLGLSRVILNSAEKEPNDRTKPQKLDLSFKEQRKETLHNFHKASLIFKEATDLSDFSIVFKSDKGSREFPFWNNINGPIEDAIWHAGQIVVLRRSAGNPIAKGVNVFLGTKTD